VSDLQIESLDSFEVEDPERPGEHRRVLRLALSGPRFHIGAEPVFVRVGHVTGVPAYISPDQKHMDVYLYSEPEEESEIVLVQLGHEMHARQKFNMRLLGNQGG
jgi:hypothetical protein